MSALRKESIDSNTKKRFIIALIVGVFIAIVALYVFNSCHGVFGRSTDSVSFTEWVSWNVGTIQFGNTTGNYNNTVESLFFRFEEKAGTVKMIVNEKIYMILTRFDDNLLLTSDGMDAFYYKGAWNQ